MFVSSPNSYVEALTPQCDSSWIWGLWELLRDRGGPECGAFQKELGPYKMRHGSERSPCILPCTGHKDGM